MAHGGRLGNAEREARRVAIREAALTELRDKGYERLTMLDVARRASASKETLYAWFGSKEGLFADLIRTQAEATNRAVEHALARDALPEEVLEQIARNLLRLLTGEVSVSINRAAMGAPELARILLQHGRFTTGPLIETWLANAFDHIGRGIPDPAEAFQVFYGLVIQDWQIRRLLGDPPLPAERIAAIARAATERFLALTGVEGT